MLGPAVRGVKEHDRTCPSEIANETDNCLGHPCSLLKSAPAVTSYLVPCQPAGCRSHGWSPQGAHLGTRMAASRASLLLDEHLGLEDRVQVRYSLN